MQYGITRGTGMLTQRAGTRRWHWHRQRLAAVTSTTTIGSGLQSADPIVVNKNTRQRLLSSGTPHELTVIQTPFLTGMGYSLCSQVWVRLRRVPEPVHKGG